jgi:hypothetical protein
VCLLLRRNGTESLARLLLSTGGPAQLSIGSASEGELKAAEIADKYGHKELAQSLVTPVGQAEEELGTEE